MKYKLKVWEMNDVWNWTIEDEYQEPVSDSHNEFDCEAMARKDGRIALSDWNGTSYD